MAAGGSVAGETIGISQWRSGISLEMAKKTPISGINPGVSAESGVSNGEMQSGGGYQPAARKWQGNIMRSEEKRKPIGVSAANGS
jgi:hypothetical protein